MAVKTFALPISFETTLYRIKSWTILRLPPRASAQLPSRGQIMVEGTVNGAAFKTPLEPDGKWSHWFRVNTALQKAAQAAAGSTVSVVLTPIKEWSEPDVPADLLRGLAAHPQARALWQRITPLARWEWIRWIRATTQKETRIRRIEVACSKLKAGKRRPCCWNRNICSEPRVSKSWALRESEEFRAS